LSVNETWQGERVAAGLREILGPSYLETRDAPRIITIPTTLRPQPNGDVRLTPKAAVRS
jgi:hypothetical protein